MKRTHRPDLFCWSRFDEARDVDFNGYAWVRPEGAILFDPVELSPHDRGQLERVAWIVVTNSDHLRATVELADAFGASVAGPAAERDALGLECERWLSDGDALVDGLVALEMRGSKTPGELAFLLEDTTLITGDLVRSHAGGRLDRLPDPKLADKDAALASIRGLLAHPQVDAVLVGDGWPAFRGGRALLEELVARQS
ncbi:MAG: MBL fold metallo-hydrolase [Sandaracinaceae bacterium]|nr:MBL fold metallo-hydrolase [Sandaracinaceae bacterium]